MQEIGALLVRLLFDSSDFDEGIKDSQSKLQTASASIDNVANAVNDRLTSAFKNGALAVGAFVGAATAIGANFDKEIRTVSAILGEGEEGFKRVEGAARLLGSTTEFSSTQAASALQNLARAGFSSAESVAAAGPALSLATASASGLDLATSSVAASLAQFSLQSAESARVADVLANATVSTKFGLQGLTDALKTAGPAGAAAGLSIEETVAAVSQFRNIGLDASSSGVVFRNTIQRLVAPSGQAAAAIEELGLSLDEVDPTKVGFDQALVNLRDAGLGVKSATEIFGRFGLQIVGVAKNVDNVDKGFQALASTFELEVGKAAEVAADASNNVLTRFQILGSATQEVFLSVFDSLRGPLLTVLNAVIEVVTEISTRFNDSAGEITASAQDIADAIASFLGDNAGAIADAFLAIARGAVNVTKAIKPFLEILGQLTPVISAIFNILAENANLAAAAAGILLVSSRLALLGTSAVRTAAAVTQLATAMGVDLVRALTLASTAVRSFAVSVVTSTGGLAAIAIAIAAVVAGLVQIAIKSREAAEAQRLLAAANQASSEETDRRVSSQEDLLDVLDRNQAAARETLSSGEELSAQRKRELNQILALNKATLQSAIQAGKVVEIGGQIQLVTTAVREFGAEGVAALKQVSEEAERQAGNIGAIVGPLEQQVEALGKLGTIGGAAGQATAEAAIRDIDGILAAAGAGVEDLVGLQARALDRAESEGITALQAVQAEARILSETVRIRGEQQADQAKNLATETAKAINKTQEDRTKVLEDETDARIAAGKKQSDAAKKNADDAVKAAEDAAKRISAILKRAQDAQAGFLPEPEQIRRDLQLTISALESAQADFVAAFRGTEEQRLAVLQEGTDARELLVSTANQRILTIAQNAADDQARIVESRVQTVNDFVREGVGQEEQVRRTAAATLLQLEEQIKAEQEAIRTRAVALPVDATEQQRVDAARKANEQIIALDSDAADARLAIAGTLEDQVTAIQAQRVADAERLAEQVDGFTTDIVDSFIDSAGPIESSFTTAFLNIRNSAFTEFPAVSVAITQVSKAAVNTATTMVDVFSAAFDQIRSLATAFTGEDLFDLKGFIDSGVEAIEGAQENLEDVTSQGAEDLADLQSQLQEAGSAEERLRILDEISATEAQLAADRLAAEQEIAAARDGAGAATAVNEAADRAIDFAEALPTAITAALDELAERLPEVLGAVAEAIPEAAQAIADNLGPVVQALVDALPQIVQGLTEALTTLISALPDIIGTILQALPEIITSILAAVPVIIQALVDALPGVLTALFDAIPRIISAILVAIPDIIASLLAAIPQILSALLETLPVLVTSIIQVLPDIFGAILTTIPTIIIALVDQLPRLLVTVVSYIPVLFTALITELPTLITAIITEIVTQAPALALAIGQAIIQAFREVIEQLVKIFAEIFKSAFEGLKERAEETQKTLQEGAADPDEGVVKTAIKATGALFGFQGGVPFVQRTVGAVLHPGEAVLTAAENRKRLFGVGEDNRTAPVGGANLASSSPSQAPVEVRVQVAGRDLDRVLLESDRAGQLGVSNKASRRKTGTKVGFSPRKT